MAGARWAQKDLLGPRPDAKVRVYAVWYAMFRGDARDRWPADLLTDGRVSHYWDEQKHVGRFFAPRIRGWGERRAPGSRDPLSEILWDAYLLFGPESRWDETPSHLVSWSYRLVDGRDRLAADIDRLAR